MEMVSLSYILLRFKYTLTIYNTSHISAIIMFVSSVHERNARTTPFHITLATTRHVASYEWWMCGGGSIWDYIFTTHNLPRTSCDQNCVKWCDSNIALYMIL